MRALTELGLVLHEPVDKGLDAILSVHPDHYIKFLQSAYDEFITLPNHGPEVLTNVWSYHSADGDLNRRGPPRPTGIIGRMGWYLGDLSSVIMAGTWSAALASAQAAITGAETLLAGSPAAFALCRPPGHHAYRDRASGFCFLNNAAIAAETLRHLYAKVAIVDFDTHHGDGTQAIFYGRGDVFFGSTHTDPSAYYPHFYGYADEIGIGAGEGANLNLPLAQGSGDEAFVDANARLAVAVQGFGADALVISAGWDAHEADPLSKLKVTTDAYRHIGELWGKLGLPTLIVQEGGYSLSAIAEAAPAFTAAFRDGAGV